MSSNEYKRSNMKSIAVRLHRRSDADLIAVYDQIPDKAAFMREALREYARKNGIKIAEQKKKTED